MKSNLFLKIVILILIILNLGTLSFLWFSRPGREMPQNRRERDISAFLPRELKLTKQQQQQYEKLRNEHRKRFDSIQNVNMQLHRRFFNLALIQNTDNKAVNLLVDSIAATQRSIEMITYQHFMSIRQMLNSSQKKKLHELLFEVSKMVAPPPPPGRYPSMPPLPPIPENIRK